MKRLRAFISGLGLGPARWLFLISGVAYAAILLSPRPESVLKMCGGSGISLIAFVDRTGVMPPNWSVSIVGLDWTLMCIAMMGPLISPQIAYVWRSTAKADRFICSLSCYSAYVVCWITAGGLLIYAAFASIAQFGMFGSFWIVGSVAVLWSFSPFAQIYRNRCHAYKRISGFGVVAYKDCAWLGIRTGVYCCLACWPWMMLPLFIDHAHFAAMLLIAVYLFADRIAPARQPHWGPPPAYEALVPRH